MSNRREQANNYREVRGLFGGYVVLFGNDVSGWAKDFPRPEAYVPGCIAVDEAGNQWEAVGGNEQDGAERWEVSNG
ncbi:hypothetical protein GCM10011533_30090 [Streptosporangium jomthongense]|uniref:Uncharacterized protein n=1 Tax=Marinobacter aromaticivorans TaxID=1494078 RepID=A0ABW2IYL3_9GAMM|nr:hypothetical protein [Marinobacter aromaticivorans]GGE75730.1 hypothetical protein GCM10011533_30090 [Streptosporangium jomthongense]